MPSDLWQLVAGTDDLDADEERFAPHARPLRAALLADKLSDEIAAPVTYRHRGLTIPKALPGFFQRERPLLGLRPRCACEAPPSVVGILTPDPYNGRLCPRGQAARKRPPGEVREQPPIDGRRRRARGKGETECA